MKPSCGSLVSFPEHTMRLTKRAVYRKMVAARLTKSTDS
jgi:hypothetical protein